ncbi:MAG: site-specific integrase [Fodinibius sp.]|nr:site-specific integrase [Fodinibius sp.]
MKNALQKYFRYLEVERNASKHTITSYKTDLSQFHTFCGNHFGIAEDDVYLDLIERITIRLWLGELSRTWFSQKLYRSKGSSSTFVF